MAAGQQGDVVLDVRLKASGVEQANLQMVGTFKNTERAARQSAAAVKQASAQMSVFGTQLNKVWRSALYGVTGYAAVAGVRKVFGGIAQSIKEVTDTRVDFQRTMTPLLSLSGNTNKIESLSRKVVGLSLAFGKAGEGTAPISDFLYNLQSGSFGVSAKNLGEVEKATLSLSKAVGLDLPTAMDLNLKTWHAYGKQVGSVIKIQNMLKKTTDDAYLSFQEMAQNFPTVAGTAANLGIPIEEILSAVMVGSQTTGDASVLFTGLRNLVLAFERLDQKGIKLTGTLTERFEQLKQMPEVWKEFDMRQAATLNSIMIATEGTLEKYGKELKSLSDTELETDRVISKKMRDRNTLFAEQINFLQKIKELSPLENMLSQGSSGKSFSDSARMRYELGTNLFASQKPEIFRFMAPLAGLISTLDPMLARKQEESAARYIMDTGAPGGKEWWDSIQREKHLKAYREETAKLAEATSELERFKRQVAANANSPFPYDPAEASRVEANFIASIAKITDAMNAAAGKVREYGSPQSSIYQGAKDWVAQAAKRRAESKAGNKFASLENADWGAMKDYWGGILGGVASGATSSKGGKGRIKGPGGEWIEYDPNKKSQGAINTENWRNNEAYKRGAKNTAAWRAEREAKKSPGMTGPNGEFIPFTDHTERWAAKAAVNGEYIPLSERGGSWADRLAGKSPVSNSLAARNSAWAGRFAAEIPVDYAEEFKRGRGAVGPYHQPSMLEENRAYQHKFWGEGTKITDIPPGRDDFVNKPFPEGGFGKDASVSKLSEIAGLIREQIQTGKEMLAALKSPNTGPSKTSRRPAVANGANTIME